MMSNFLENFYYRKYRVSFVVVRPFHFDGYSFSLIRGVFGKILHDDVCVHENLKDCNLCPENRYCPYTELFKIKLQPSHPLYGKYTEPPVPYILYPDFRGRSKFVRGNTFAIELTLIGKAIEYDTFLLQIVQQIGEGEGLLYHKLECSGIETLMGDDKKSHLRFTAPPCKVKQVKLNFLSPMIFKDDPSTDSLPFHDLMKSLTERISVLNQLYCDGREADLKSFDGKTTGLEYMDSFYKIKIEVKKKVYKDALLGSVAYRGSLDKYMPLIRAGAVLHFGRLTNYGLGKYAIVDNY